MPWLQMGVLHPIHRVRFRSVQSLDLPFLILMCDYGVYSTYALIGKNEYYMRRNLIQVYYGTNVGGVQLWGSPLTSALDGFFELTLGEH